MSATSPFPPCVCCPLALLSRIPSLPSLPACRAQAASSPTLCPSPHRNLTYSFFPCVAIISLLSHLPSSSPHNPAGLPRKNCRSTLRNHSGPLLGRPSAGGLASLPLFLANKLLVLVSGRSPLRTSFLRSDFVSARRDSQWGGTEGSFKRNVKNKAP